MRKIKKKNKIFILEEVKKRLIKKELSIFLISFFYIIKKNEIEK